MAIEKVVERNVIQKIKKMLLMQGLSIIIINNVRGDSLNNSEKRKFKNSKIKNIISLFLNAVFITL